MGLDLSATSGAHLRVGSYSSVHVLRAALLSLYAREREAAGDAAGAERVLNWLRLPPTPDAPPRDANSAVDALNADPNPFRVEVDYAGIQRDGSGDAPGLADLLALIDHSDCDDGHSPDETARIADALDRLAGRFGELNSGPRLHALREFFRDVARARGAVTYG